MALKVLLLRNKLDIKKKSLQELRDKDPDFEKREKELEDAINEMTEETSEEDRKVVEQQAEDFQKEKDEHEKDKKNLETEIEGIEEEIRAEEEKQPKPEPAEGRGKEGGAEKPMEVRGRDLTDGLPRNETITSVQVEEAMKESISKIVEIVKATLEKTPPELASDIMEKGIVLAGGGALIRNLDKLISMETGMPVYVAEEPLDCVVRGAGKTLEDLERLKTVLINARKRR